jgi:hypothetical protein
VAGTCRATSGRARFPKRACRSRSAWSNSDIPGLQRTGTRHRCAISQRSHGGAERRDAQATRRSNADAPSRLSRQLDRISRRQSSERTVYSDVASRLRRCIRAPRVPIELSDVPIEDLRRRSLTTVYAEPSTKAPPRALLQLPARPTTAGRARHCRVSDRNRPLHGSRSQRAAAGG